MLHLVTQEDLAFGTLWGPLQGGGHRRSATPETVVAAAELRHYRGSGAAKLTRLMDQSRAHIGASIWKRSSLPA